MYVPLPPEKLLAKKVPLPGPPSQLAVILKETTAFVGAGVGDGVGEGVGAGVGVGVGDGVGAGVGAGVQAKVKKREGPLGLPKLSFSTT